MHRNSIPAIALSALMALIAGAPRAVHGGDGKSAAGEKPGAGRAQVREALLRKRVRTQLLKHIKDPDAQRIHVTTREQTVTLTGEVGTQANYKLAGTLARSAVGVLRVNNNLTVAEPDESKIVVAATAAARIAPRKTRVKTRQVAQAGVPAPKIDTVARASTGTDLDTAPDSAQPGTAPILTPVTAASATGEGKAAVDKITLASDGTAVTPE